MTSQAHTKSTTLVYLIDIKKIYKTTASNPTEKTFITEGHGFLPKVDDSGVYYYVLENEENWNGVAEQYITKNMCYIVSGEKVIYLGQDASHYSVNTFAFNGTSLIFQDKEKGFVCATDGNVVTTTGIDGFAEN